MIQKLKKIYRENFWTPERYARSIGVKIGKNCKIYSKNFGSEPYLIEIGNHVQITAGVRFSNHGGSWVFREKYPNFDFFGKIKIGNNVYIGNNAFIFPGVTVGNNVIIGGATTVTKSVPDNAIIAGNPGKIVGNVNELEQRILPYNIDCKNLNRTEKKKLLLSLDDSQFIRK